MATGIGTTDPGATAPGSTGPGRGLQVLAYVIALLLGLVLAVAGSVLQAYGLAFSLVGLVVILGAEVLCGTATANRGGALAVYLPLTALTLFLSAPRPEGDLLIPATGAGYVWVYGASLVGLAGIAPNYRRFAA